MRPAPTAPRVSTWGCIQSCFHHHLASDGCLASPGLNLGVAVACFPSLWLSGGRGHHDETSYVPLFHHLDFPVVMGCSLELGVRRHLSPQAAFARGVSCSSERRRPLRLRLAPGSDVRLRTAGEMGTGALLRTLRVGRGWTLAPGPQFPHLGD